MLANLRRNFVLFSIIMTMLYAMIMLTVIVRDCVQSSVVNHVIDSNLGEDDECSSSLPTSLIQEIKLYQPVVNDIINQIVNGKYAGNTWKSLAEFTDRFGPRMSGSTNLENAIDYMVQHLKDAGLENVHTESAEVPHWERGEEHATIQRPFVRRLPILGLGSSVGTPPGGLTAEIVVVQSYNEFERIAESTVKGKIVVFVPKWEGYAKTVKYRGNSASVAAKKGAVAALVRSVTPFSIGSPHTGMQSYEDGVPKIPVACITVEDALSLLREYRRNNTIVIHLEMNAKNYEPTMSRNTIGELQGKNNVAKSVVVLSGHLDSWDVGVGAMDDGGGAFISAKAVEFLRKMNYKPKRTIRAILWTGEEQGYYGSRAYMHQHKQFEIEEFNFFIESDTGTFQPFGMDFTGTPEAECIFKLILNLMHPLNATEFRRNADGGPDISVWVNRGFPGASLLNRNEEYFWYHHSFGDSMIVERPDNLDKAAALFAAVAYVIADINVDFPKNVTRHFI